MEGTMFCSLNIQDTVNLIQHAVVDGSITGECIDSYCVSAPNGGTCAVLVYEKHYYRAGNRLTLTVVVDDFTGRTRVHCASGGGGEGLFRFDGAHPKAFLGLSPMLWLNILFNVQRRRANGHSRGPKR